MKRRNFIKSSVATTALASLPLTNFGCAQGEKKEDVAMAKTLSEFGVQLYTVRSLLENDFEGTIRKVAALGYKQFEFHSYFGNSPADVSALLKELDVTAPAIHVPLDRFRNNLDEQLEAASVIGHKYLIVPWLNKAEYDTLDKLKAQAAEFNKFAQTCKAAGVGFAYHNHDFEFEAVEGEIMMDVFLTETDPDLVDMELDLYWITKAGKDPLEYFSKYPGRFKSCHVKDMTSEGGMTSVGAGTIDFGKIFAESELAGLEYYFVEHDRPEDPMMSIESSIKVLREKKFNITKATANMNS